MHVVLQPRPDLKGGKKKGFDCNVVCKPWSDSGYETRFDKSLSRV